MTEVTAEELWQELLTERFGPLRDLRKERPRKPAETMSRRRVLLGDNEMRSK